MESPKIFFAHLREMTERFDPRYVAFRRRTAEFRYPMVRLSELLSALPEYGAGEAGIERTNIKQPRYIRITDINDDGELSPELGATAETVEAKYFLSDGDLLFARSGATVGKCYLHEKSRVEYPCFYAGYMIRIRLKPCILPKYVFAFTQTSYYREWVASVQRAAGQPNINAQEYCSLRLPLPPIDVQERLVAELDAACVVKRKADEKAAELLASIDDIVLDVLGIPPIPPVDISLAARIFMVSAREVADERLDAYYHQDYFRKIAKTIAIDDRTMCLGKIGNFVRGVTYSADDEENDGFAVLRANNVSLETGEIDLTDLVHVRRDLCFDRAQRICSGDILICVASGSKEHAGKVAYVEDDLDDAFAGGFMTILRVKESVAMPKYVAVYMQSQIFRRLILRHLGGTNINNVSLGMLNALPIIVPSNDEQEEIVAKVTSIRATAKSLKSDAQSALVSAKKRIESEIIGE